MSGPGKGGLALRQLCRSFNARGVDKMGGYVPDCSDRRDGAISIENSMPGPVIASSIIAFGEVSGKCHRHARRSLAGRVRVDPTAGARLLWACSTGVLPAAGVLTIGADSNAVAGVAAGVLVAGLRVTPARSVGTGIGLAARIAGVDRARFSHTGLHRRPCILNRDDTEDRVAAILARVYRSLGILYRDRTENRIAARRTCVGHGLFDRNSASWLIARLRCVRNVDRDNFTASLARRGRPNGIVKPHIQVKVVKLFRPTHLDRPRFT
jgi:hypothetical protein